MRVDGARAEKATGGAVFLDVDAAVAGPVDIVGVADAAGGVEIAVVEDRQRGGRAVDVGEVDCDRVERAGAIAAALDPGRREDGLVAMAGLTETSSGRRKLKAPSASAAAVNVVSSP